MRMPPAYHGLMVVRRAILRWQLFAAVALPVWLFVGFGVFGSGAGGFFLLFIGAGVLFVFLAVLAGLTRLRPRVRETRAIGWWDVAVTVAFHLAVIGLGFFGVTGVAFGVATVLLGLAAFWLTLWELTTEWRNKVSDAVAKASGTAGSSRSASRRHAPSDGDVIVIHEPGR